MMRIGVPLCLVLVVWLVGVCPTRGWTAAIDPDALTVADFAFLQGADDRFVAAYRLFLKAKAGDQEEGVDLPTYGQAARAFLGAADRAADTQMGLRCLWLGAFCQFLHMDLAGAAQSARAVPDRAEAACPRETAQVREIIGQVDSGRIATAAAMIPLLRTTGEADPAPGLEEEVAGRLAAILERNDQTRQARAGVTTCELRLRVFDLGTAEEQLRTIAVLACFFREMSLSVSENRQKIDQALCAANLRQLGLALHLYAEEHEGFFPEAYETANRQIWQLKVFPYTADSSWSERGDVWHCSACVAGGYSYGINQSISIRSEAFPTQGDRGRIARPQQTVLLADSVHYLPGEYPHRPNYGGAAYKIHSRKEHSGTGTIDWNRHSGGANVLFVDGHVQWCSPATVLEWVGR